MFNAETTDMVRSFIIDLLIMMKLDYRTIMNIDRIIPFQYYPLILFLFGLIVFLICIIIILKRSNKRREEKFDEKEFLESEKIKKEEEDKRLSIYHGITQMMGDELGVSEAKIEFELEKIFKNSPQLKDSETYHRVTIKRTPNERDVILSNWYMSNDKVEVIKKLIEEEIKKSEVNNIKNEKLIREAQSSQKESQSTWECGNCGNINYGSEEKCLKCGKLRNI